MEPIENTAINNEYRQGGGFVPADVLRVFSADLLDSEKCKMWIIEKLHQNNARCPGCGAAVPDRLMHSFWDCKRIACDKCGKYFTTLTGTFLSGCHFDFREIFLLAFLLSLGVSDKKIAQIIKISAESVRLWRLKFAGMERT